MDSCMKNAAAKSFGNRLVMVVRGRVSTTDDDPLGLAPICEPVRTAVLTSMVRRDQNVGVDLVSIQQAFESAFL